MHCDISSFVAVIQSKFDETGDYTTIPLLTRGTFNAERCDDGVLVSNLGFNLLLPWDIFQVVERLLREKGGEAERGNAMGYVLGDVELSLDSVEGRVASKIYDKVIGETVFRRITPITCILIWAGVCLHKPRKLLINPCQPI